MATKPNDGMRAYWREKKAAWRKQNPNKDKEYEKKNSGHNSRVKQNGKK